MNFAIRYLTEYELRRRRRRQPQRAARQAARPTAASAATSSASGSRPRSACTATPTTSAPRWSSSRSRGRTAQLTIDVRARVEHQDARPSRRRRPGRRSQTPAYREAGGEFLLQTDDAPGHPVLARAAGHDAGRRRRRWRRVLLVSELIPDRFEYRRGATYVDSRRRRPARGRRRASARTSSTSGCACCATTGSPPATCRATCSRPAPTRSAESVEVDTHAWLEALLPGPDGGEPVWVGADPTNRVLAGETHVKIGHGRHYADVPADQGRLPRRRRPRRSRRASR